MFGLQPETAFKPMILKDLDRKIWIIKGLGVVWRRNMLGDCYARRKRMAMAHRCTPGQGKTVSCPVLSFEFPVSG